MGLFESRKKQIYWFHREFQSAGINKFVNQLIVEFRDIEPKIRVLDSTQAKIFKKIQPRQNNQIYIICTKDNYFEVQDYIRQEKEKERQKYIQKKVSSYKQEFVVNCLIFCTSQQEQIMIKKQSHQQNCICITPNFQIIIDYIRGHINSFKERQIHLKYQDQIPQLAPKLVSARLSQNKKSKQSKGQNFSTSRTNQSKFTNNKQSLRKNKQYHKISIQYKFTKINSNITTNIAQFRKTQAVYYKKFVHYLVKYKIDDKDNNKFKTNLTTMSLQLQLGYDPSQSLQKFKNQIVQSLNIPFNQIKIQTKYNISKFKIQQEYIKCIMGCKKLQQVIDMLDQILYKYPGILQFFNDILAHVYDQKNQLIDYFKSVIVGFLYKYTFLFSSKHKIQRAYKYIDYNKQFSQNELIMFPHFLFTYTHQKRLQSFRFGLTKLIIDIDVETNKFITFFPYILRTDEQAIFMPYSFFQVTKILNFKKSNLIYLKLIPDDSLILNTYILNSNNKRLNNCISSTVVQQIMNQEVLNKRKKADKSSKQTAQSFLNLSLIYYKIGYIKKGLEFFQQYYLINRNKLSCQQLYNMAALQIILEILIAKQDKQSIEDIYQNLQEQLMNKYKGQNLVNKINKYINVLMQFNLTDLAEKIMYKFMIHINHLVNFSMAKFYFHYNMAKCQCSLGKNQKGQEFYKSAQKCIKTGQKNIQYYNFYIELSHLMMILRKRQDRLKYLLKAQLLAEKIDDQENMLQTYLLLQEYYKQKNDKQNQQHYMKKVKEYMQSQ